jgi:PAS domain S-box-containing protein
VTARRAGTRFRLFVTLLVGLGFAATIWTSRDTVQSLDQVTSDFSQAEQHIAGLANLQRETLRLQEAVLRHLQGGPWEEVDVKRAVLVRQLTAYGTPPPFAGPGSSEYDGAEQLLRTMTAFDWEGLRDAVAAEDPRAATRAAAIDAELTEYEIFIKQAWDRADRTFFDVTFEGISAKERSQGAMIWLILVTGAVGVASLLRWRRESRQDLDAAYGALRASDERFKLLVHRSSDITLVAQGDATIAFASPAIVGCLDRDPDEVVGQPVYELVHADDVDRIRAQVEGCPAGESVMVSFRLGHADGSWREVEATCTNLLDDEVVAGTVLNVRDVSDRRRLERELRHTQKLESVGQLAAGIAHEINTPIQFVGDNVRFLADAFSDLSRFALACQRAAAEGDAGARATAEAIAREVDADQLLTEVPLAVEQTLEGISRVATIVRAMKAFGHPSTDSKAPADLNEAIRNTVIVANNEIKQVAELDLDLAELPDVWCHAGDLNQVLLNLVVNAADAIRDQVAGTSDVGRITIRSRAGADAVTLEVEDTGAGIPADIASRIFEPFFTTKSVGRGTGQGLALAYGLVTDRHGGSLTFTSDAGLGTTFRVTLPVAPAHGDATLEAVA